LNHDPEWWAQKLVDWVATVTQLDPDKGELANVDDWKRCAEKLFANAIKEARGMMTSER
jgi:hypothetical protein